LIENRYTSSLLMD